MKFTAEDYLDLNGPMLRGPFNTAALRSAVGESQTKDYIDRMQAEHKMFWMGTGKDAYYSYQELPLDESSDNPMVRMPYRYGGQRYSVGSMVVYDAPPYPVRDTANQHTHVYRSRRAAFDGAVRMAIHRTPYGSDLPLQVYKDIEQEIVEHDENGRPIGYGRMVYISSANALNILLGEPMSKSLVDKIREMFPHASYLAHGAPLVTAHVSGGIGVYRTMEDLMSKYPEGRLTMLDRGIGITTTEEGRIIEEIVAGWKYASLSRLLHERGTGLHPSEYDLLLSAV